MDLRDWARQIAELHERSGRNGINPYRLLADHGQEAEFTPLPEGEQCGQAKGCYGNATHRVLLGGPGLEPDESLTYYEGLCLSGFPIEHAWAQDADGRVYELTLRHNDDRCPYCNGEGEIHPTDHWAYTAPDDDDEDFYEDWTGEPDEFVTCEMCEGSGKHEAEDRTGTIYLGIPIDHETLRASMIANRTYGVLFTDPKRVAEMLGVTS